MTRRKTRAEKRLTPKCHPHCRRLRDGSVRHVFTREESQAGFWAAIESIVIRHPDAVNGDGSHMARYFLRSRNPLWFATRSLRAKVDKMQARHPDDRKPLAELKRGLAQLEKQARGATQRATTRNRGGSK
jgi:hypothetical protein